MAKTLTVYINHEGAEMAIFPSRPEKSNPNYPYSTGVRYTALQCSWEIRSVAA